MASSALYVRPADCLLGGNPLFGAHRGVRASPAPRRPVPQQQMQRYVQVATTASTSAPVRPRPARGRANGRRQRGRRSPRGAGSPSTEKRVVENVVILKRGEEQIVQAKVAAAPELAATQAVAKSGVQAEKADPVAEKVQKAQVVAAADKHITRAVGAPGTVAAANQSSSAQGENAEPVVAAADTQAERAEQQQRGEDATNAATKTKVAAAADQTAPRAKNDKDAKNMAGPKRSGGQGKKKKPGAAPPILYSGLSFAAAPEPRELPIPFLLLKGRGARLRPRDERAAPTAAAA